MPLIDLFATNFQQLHLWLFEQWVQPMLFALGLMPFADDAFIGLEWMLIGLLEVVFIALVIGCLQRWRPVEPVLDRQAIRVDFLYTLLHRLGIFSLLIFFLLTPVFDGVKSQLHAAQFLELQVEQLYTGVTDIPWISFTLYLLLLDFVDYWIHRGQHRFRWWWALHAVHHSQRQMTMWSDNRNHLLDDLFRDALMASVALLIGVPPGQYMGIVVASRVLQSLQHANLKISFGWLGERLLVSPRFHRIHHAIGLGHEGRAQGCNFAVLFAWWDTLFGTADHTAVLEPTGIRDQLAGRDYGRGFWQQQWLGLKRMFRHE